MKEIIPKKFTITKIKKKYFYHLKKIYNQELANKLIFTIFIFWKNNFNLILNVSTYYKIILNYFIKNNLYKVQVI